MSRLFVAALLQASILMGAAATSNAGFTSGQASGSGAGTISGTVVDPTGAVVARAQVVLKNAVTNYQKEVTTGPDGSFQFLNVPNNQYKLDVAAPGFQSVSKAVAIRSAVPAKLTIELSLASAIEQVTVESGPADLLEPVPTAHTDVDHSLMDQAANYVVVARPERCDHAHDTWSCCRFQRIVSSHGRPCRDIVCVDGMPISDQQSKSFSTQIPPNALQSMELVSGGPNAEYGDKTGLVVNAVTRSGLGQKPTGSLETYYGSFGTYRRERNVRRGHREVRQFPGM